MYVKGLHVYIFIDFINLFIIINYFSLMVYRLGLYIEVI